jgi:hypothetical protein
VQTQVEELPALLGRAQHRCSFYRPETDVNLQRRPLLTLHLLGQAYLQGPLQNPGRFHLSLPKETIEQMLKSRRINDEIIRSTMEGPCSDLQRHEILQHTTGWTLTLLTMMHINRDTLQLDSSGGERVRRGVSREPAPIRADREPERDTPKGRQATKVGNHRSLGRARNHNAPPVSNTTLV